MENIRLYPPEHAFLRDARILLVEEHHDGPEPLASALLAGASRLFRAADGVQACQRARAICPDLILMQVQLPLMDGIAACRALAMDARTRRIPVIFFTAGNDPAQRIAAFEAGAVDVTQKTIEVAELLARIRIHLARRPGTPHAASAEHAGYSDDGALVRRVIQRLLDSPDTLPAVDELARQMGTDYVRLAQVFEDHTGETLHHYLLEERLRAAQRLLAGTALGVGRIAEQTGFASPGLLPAAFRERFDLSPLAYRQQQRLCARFAAAVRDAVPHADVLPQDHTLDCVTVRAAMRHLALRLANPPTLDELARAVGSTETRLSRAFSKYLGRTAFEYLRDLRLRLAQRLLGTPLSIVTIAQHTGYSSAANFATAFRQHFGTTPSAYRDQLRRSRPVLPSLTATPGTAAPRSLLTSVRARRMHTVH